MYIPEDLKSQCGAFENEVLEQKDAKTTDFLEPFDNSPCTERIRQAQWIKSESLGKAFLFCTKSRKITEYATK